MESADLPPPTAQAAAAAAPPVLPPPPLPLPALPAAQAPPVVAAPPAFALEPGCSHAVLDFDDPNAGAIATKLYYLFSRREV